jgi:hypothetical protein
MWHVVMQYYFQLYRMRQGNIKIQRLILLECYVLLKVKAIVAIKTWGSGGMAPPFLTLALGGWVVGFSSLPLYPWRGRHCYPLHRRLGGPHSLSARCDGKKSSAWNITRAVQCVGSRYTAPKKLNSMVWVRERTIPTERSAILLLQGTKGEGGTR